MNTATVAQDILRVYKGVVQPHADHLAVEEPLNIKTSDANHAGWQDLTMTMRTPGNDEELVTGLLITEKIIDCIDDVKELTVTTQQGRSLANVTLGPAISLTTKKARRNFFSTSSCGICGKASDDELVQSTPVNNNTFRINASLLYQLPAKLRQSQATFEFTGGLHAVGLFDGNELLYLFEDVGRHNAMDKVVGAAARDRRLPLSNHIVMLSGRASFELLSKAAIAQVPVVAAIGAPSSLAVSIADKNNITLVGFLSDQRFNIYTHPERVIIDEPTSTV